MTIRELFAKVQRNFVFVVFLSWAAATLAMSTLQLPWGLYADCAAVAVMLAAFVYLYRVARCPRCGAKLWLSLNKLAPLGPFRPRLNNCPSCGTSADDPA